MRITNPKWVKRANQWVVSIITKNDKGQERQEQSWFNTYDEALAYKLTKESDERTQI